MRLDQRPHTPAGSSQGGDHAQGAWELDHSRGRLLAVSIVARAFIDALELHSWQRYVAYVPIILLLWYSANRIMDWGRQRPRNAK